MNDFPVDFQAVAKGGDQLKPISSSDLMRNFAWAKLQVDPTLVEEGTSMGFSSQKLKFPPLPSDGSISWLEVEFVENNSPSKAYFFVNR